MRPVNPETNRTAVEGSGIVVSPEAVPSTTKLSIRLLPVEVVAPLKTILNAAFGLLLSPTMLDKVKTIGTDPKAVAGTKGDPKSVKVIPSRLYWN